jgi:hypothetical protein
MLIVSAPDFSVKIKMTLNTINVKTARDTPSPPILWISRQSIALQPVRARECVFAGFRHRLLSQHVSMRASRWKRVCNHSICVLNLRSQSEYLNMGIDSPCYILLD